MVKPMLDFNLSHSQHVDDALRTLLAFYSIIVIRMTESVSKKLNKNNLQ